MADNYYVDESYLFNFEKEFEDALEKERRNQIFRNDFVVHEQPEVPAFEDPPNSFLQNGSNFSVSNYSREVPFAFSPDVTQYYHQGFDIPTSSSLDFALHSNYEAAGENPANCFSSPVESIGVDCGRTYENHSNPSAQRSSIAWERQRPAQKKRPGTESFGAVGSGFGGKGNEAAEFLFLKKPNPPVSGWPPLMPVERIGNEATALTDKDHIDWSSAHATFPPMHAISSIGKTTENVSPGFAAGAETVHIAGPSVIQTPSRRKGKKKLFKCEVCQKTFDGKYKLEAHNRTHTGEKPYECNICGKKFSGQGSRTTHLRIHTGEKSFECVTCGKGFAVRSNLKTHVRTHTGEKPFGCDSCGKRFAHKSSLTRHLRVHTGEKPFHCDICGKRFADESSRKRHLQTHTRE